MDCVKLFKRLIKNKKQVDVEAIRFVSRSNHKNKINMIKYIPRVFEGN